MLIRISNAPAAGSHPARVCQEPGLGLSNVSTADPRTDVSAVEAMSADMGGYSTDRAESYVPAKQPFLAGFRVGNRLTRNEQVGGSSSLVGSFFSPISKLNTQF